MEHLPKWADVALVPLISLLIAFNVVSLSNDFVASARDYDDAYRAEPRIVGSLYGRGVARLRLGQVDAGRADIAAALSRDPRIAARYSDYGISP